MSDVKHTAVFIGKETFRESFYKDLTTAATLAFLIYISKHGVFWQFLTGFMALAVVLTKVKQAAGLMKVFKTKAELVAWANSLPEA